LTDEEIAKLKRIKERKSKNMQQNKKSLMIRTKQKKKDVKNVRKHKQMVKMLRILKKNHQKIFLLMI
jgi:hypothetical protein